MLEIIEYNYKNEKEYDIVAEKYKHMKSLHKHWILYAQDTSSW